MSGTRQGRDVAPADEELAAAVAACRHLIDRGSLGSLRASLPHYWASVFPEDVPEWAADAE